MVDVLERALRELDSLPVGEQERIAHVLAAEVRKTRRAAKSPAERWARLASRLSDESPLAGRSEELQLHARAFRDGFAMREHRKAR